MQRSKKIIDGYEMRKSLNGYRIIEYYHYNSEPVRKHSIMKNLNQSDAEDALWRLENKRAKAKGH